MARTDTSSTGKKKRTAWKPPRWLQTVVLAWTAIIAIFLCFRGQWIFAGILALFVTVFMMVVNQEQSDKA